MANSLPVENLLPQNVESIINYLQYCYWSSKMGSCQLQSTTASYGQWHCGTCHMASLFSPLPGTTTTAVCSSSNLLVATFTQHLASHPTSAPFLMTSSPLPSPLTVTSHQNQKGLMPLLALLLFSTPFVMHSSQLTLCYQVTCLKTLVTTTSSYLILIRSPLNSEDFYCRNGVLATDSISTASAPHQRC